MNRLAVFFDGTWDDPNDRTNVWRLQSIVAPHGHDGAAQSVRYLEGVGTGRFDRLRGGIGGEGLSETIQQGYAWLAEHHEGHSDEDDADEIFIFGFSRGAYSARSLAGFVERFGLLQPGAPMSVPQVYQLYRDGYTITGSRRHGGVGAADDAEVRERLRPYSKRVDIRFIGIWDTVGSLGIPFGNVRGISRSQFEFHDTYPSRAYKETCHALALDENRQTFDATMWTNYLPLKPGTEEIADPSRLAEAYHPGFEQRWFAGAHSDVGGGGKGSLLSDIPLRWIQERASGAGLAFTESIPAHGPRHLDAPITDSFHDFLFGIYQRFKHGDRWWRSVGRPRVRVDGEHGAGLIQTVNETIDPSVVERWRHDPKYRPPNLVRWAEGSGVDLDTVDITRPVSIRT